MEIVVVIVAFLLGYWIISAWMERSERSAEGSSSQRAKESPRNGSERAQDNAERRDDQREQQPQHEADALISRSWFLVLGVSEDATPDQIAAAYKLMIRQYHPDKVAQMGSEIRELAEFKSKQINTAYDYAMKLRH